MKDSQDTEENALLEESESTSTNSIDIIDQSSVVLYEQKPINLHAAVGSEVSASGASFPGFVEGLAEAVKDSIIASTELTRANAESMKTKALSEYKVAEATSAKLQSEAARIDQDTRKEKISNDNVQVSQRLYKLVIWVLPVIGFGFLGFDIYFIYSGIVELGVIQFIQNNWIIVLFFLAASIASIILPFAPLVQNFANVIAKLKNQSNDEDKK